MGFHVTLKENDQRLLDAVRQNPAEVFGRPYAGYLLFLLGAADSEAIEWLKTHLVALDSLTDEHVAFGVFAEKIPIRLNVLYSPDGERHSRFLGDAPITDVRRIDSYVKAGKLGRVADGDHLNAMTYASDRVARAFGVLEHLPCVLVLDALGSDNVAILGMGEAQIGDLFPVLRLAMHRLIQDPQFTKFNDALLILGNLQQEHGALANRVTNVKYALSRIPVSNDVDASFKAVYEGLRAALKEGSHGEFERRLDSLRSRCKGFSSYPGDGFRELDKITGQKVVGYGKTITAINAIDQCGWPLSEADQARCKELISRHVSRLLLDIPVCDRVIDKENLQALRQLLVGRQSVTVENIMGSLPDESALAAFEKQEHERRRIEAEQTLESLGNEAEVLRESGKEAFQFCMSETAPSLTKIVRKLGQEKRVRVAAGSVKDKATAYAGKLLDPKMIMTVIDALGKAT